LANADQFHQRVTICALPDNVLLEIFNSYMGLSWDGEDGWHRLVHICQKWRCIVFASPRRLGLQLLCTDKRPVKELLNIWPPLPIVIRGHRAMLLSQLQDAGNILATLEHPERIHRIDLNGIPSGHPLLTKIRAMKEPLPSLTYLSFGSCSKMEPVLPDSFLGAYAPLLRTFRLDGIPFPALGKLLLSTGGLVTLVLRRIPQSGYIAPKAMIAVLSTLPKLDWFELGFLSPRPPADRASQYTPPLTHIILPTLTTFLFKGDSEYLEEFLSQIDPPLLSFTGITFFNQLLFDTPLLRQFIHRTQLSKAPQQANISFHDNGAYLSLSRPNGITNTIQTTLRFQVLCRPSDWQLSSLAQVCSSFLPPIPTLVRLQIDQYRQHWEDDIENIQWLELLQPFAFVEGLTLWNRTVGFVAPALQEFTSGGATDVLPALQDIVIRGPEPLGPIYEAIEKFVSPRQLSGHLIATFYAY